VNSGNKLRIVLYLIAIIGLVLAAQWKKAVIIEKKNQTVVSLPNEYAEHGKPVDVEQLKRSDFYDVFRVGINTTKKKSVIYLSKNEVSKIKAGQNLLHPETGNIVGSVSKVSKQAQLSTGLFVAELELDKKLINGSPYVDVVLKANQKSIRVSLDAVINTNSTTLAKVYVVGDENKAQTKEVKLGLKSHNKVEILEGLNEGEKVVVNGHKFLEVGDKLRVRNCINCVIQNDEVAK
jgi:hypothetical protein